MATSGLINDGNEYKIVGTLSIGAQYEHVELLNTDYKQKIDDAVSLVLSAKCVLKVPIYQLHV
ncbi:hypothetical protein O9993_03445 [Vibrio lentus]|nr:hypothetical protein [Vibrio lentus]